MSETSPSSGIEKTFTKILSLKNEGSFDKKKTIANNVKVESFASVLMMGFENIRDMTDNPEVYHYTRDMVSEKPIGANPEAWVFSHIGDIFETSALFTATRLSLTLVDHLLKKATKDKVGIPDEAGFWLSLAIGTLLPSLVELNQVLPIHLMPEYQGDPADLFGIGVAAVVLIAGHYSRDALEQVKNMKSKRVDNSMTV
jgi:hypothetical protein